MWHTYPSDYELLYYCMQEDEWAVRALIEKYQAYSKKIVRDCIAQCSALEMFREDFILETMIALMDSVRCYREMVNCSFGTFYFTCAQRRVKSMVRHFLCDTSVANIKAVSLDALVKDETELQFIELIEAPNACCSPIYLLDYKEASLRVKETVGSLQNYEKQVLDCYLSGLSYEESSKLLGCKLKKFDNDVQRIKKRIKTSVYNVR